MDSRQEAKLNMYHAVISHCDANAAIVATVPAFATLLTAFKAKVSSIDSTAALEAQVISGIATDKKVMRTNLCQQAADIAAVVYSYAVSVANNTLKEEVDFSKSELKDLRDDQLAPTCRNIHDAANDNLVALATYGITAPMLAAFDTLIDDYAAAVPKPRNAAALRKTYASTLKTLYKDSSGMLDDQMDPLAVQFKAANLEFYTTYKNNRITVDPAVSNTRVAGDITDSVTTNGLYQVEVKATKDGIEFFTIKSNLDGSYSLRVPFGVYTITYTIPSHTTHQVTNVQVLLGQTTTLDVQLIPV
jgi:hypothetical protein